MTYYLLLLVKKNKIKEREVNMGGPYFKEQIQEECGCYYPDIILLGDDNDAKRRISHCVKHGEISIPFCEISNGQKKGGELPLLAIPSDEWKEKERERLRGI